MTRIEQSIEVNAPAHTVYNQLTQFEQYPRFMEDIKEVRQLDNTHLHWRARMSGRDMEWDAEILEQVPDQVIAWRNTDGPIKSERVEVRPLDGDKAKVSVAMEYETPPQQGADTEASIAGHAVHDLVRFKQFIESRGQETGAWRGEVHQGRETSPGGGPEQSAQPAQPGQSAGTGQQQQAAPGGQNPALTAMSSMDPQAWLPSMLHAWEEPFVIMRKMTEDMDQLFERFIGRPMYGAKQKQGTAQAAGTWSPPLEVAQSGDKLLVRVELPGVKQENVRVEIKNDRLVIEGDRQEEPQQARGFSHTERPYGHFYRALAMPDGVNPEQAAASLRDGVLEISIPVQQTARQGRQLDVR
jgi:HSP20 family molecular chaperone IbpA/uncharacterized protein YndB with AHSA1/START domain